MVKGYSLAAVFVVLVAVLPLMIVFGPGKHRFIDPTLFINPTRQLF